MSGAMLLYLLTISLWLILAALTAEWLLIRLKKPARWPWVIAMLLCVTLPFMPAIPREAPQSGPTAPVAEPTAIASALPAAAPSSTAWVPAFSVDLGWFYAASGIAATLLIVGWALLVVRSRRWQVADMDGATVLVSPTTGPAVLGFFLPEIVVPDWAFELPVHQRRMLLAHEQSHIDARDPLLLFLAALVVVAMPWNPLLWFGLSRLRGAIEIDCDRRVLRAGETADDYARCLVDSVTLAAGGPVPAVGSLSLSTSFLERRVDLMLRPARSLKILSLLASVATVALVSSAFRTTPPAPDAVRWSKAVQALEARPYKQSESYYSRLLNGKVGDSKALYGVFYDNWSIRDPKAKGC